MERNIDSLAKEIQREYYRNWRKRNPDKVREKNRRYWERKAEKMQSERTGKDNGKNEI